ncbi:MAG: CBS domain-containing protein [Desulfobacteraceae bacterium]|nr:CBS domain-containing protein [Desulfobacteraceae bacterium]
MDSESIFRTLVRTDPFDMLDTEVLKSLCDKVIVREYKPNTYVFRQGEQSQDCLFVIASGFVEITVTNERGVETVIGLRRIYDFFGETVALSGSDYSGSARVKDDLCCYLISRRDLEELLYAYPEFFRFLCTLLTERIRMLYKEVITERSYDAYIPHGNVESSLFRKRVSEIMSFPVITCRATDKVVQASKIMAEKDINAIVALDNENKPRGILTQKSLVKYLIAGQLYPIEQCRVEHLMHSNLVEIGPEAFIGQALVAMMRSKTKHLMVTERGGLVGIVSMVDLMKTQSTGTMLLTRDIESQPSMDGLVAVSLEIAEILNVMIAEKAAVHEIFDVMSELHERLTAESFSCPKNR